MRVANKKIVAFIVCQTLLMLSQVSLALDTSELADICEAMETAIIDIEIEYQVHNDPPLTIDDIAGTGGLVNDGPFKQRLTLKQPIGEYLLFSQNAVFVNKHGDSYEDFINQSYNADIVKHFQRGGIPLEGATRKEPLTGTVCRNKRLLPNLNMTPLGFSVLRIRLGPEKTYLSELLRMQQENDAVKIDDKVRKINGFKTVTADILANWNKQVVVLRVYFSIDHGYTPVRYEYMNGQKLAYSVNTTSLEEVATGIWFPKAGYIRATGEERVHTVQVTSKIIVNQGLKDEMFDIEFPPGTRVSDKIANLNYVVRPTEGQFNEWLLAEEVAGRLEAKNNRDNVKATALKQSTRNSYNKKEDPAKHDLLSQDKAKEPHTKSWIYLSSLFIIIILCTVIFFMRKVFWGGHQLQGR